MIILLGLQIFKVANQLINNSNGGDLGLPSFPIPLFDDFVLNYKPFRSIDKNRDSREQNSNQTYFPNKFDSNNNFNAFSKRNGFYGSRGNQSIPFDGQTGKYSKHIPKPYPYSRGSQTSDQNVYSYQKPQSNNADSKFSKYNIKPDWNEFEDSIDLSLNEQDTYYPNKPQLKNEMKREEESTPQTDDTFESDYNDSDYPPDFDNNNDNNSDNNSDNNNDNNNNNMDDGYYDGIDEDDIQEENPESAKYREEETPECAYGHSYCFLDEEYPEDSMRTAVDKQMDILTQILPESTETFDLVEGISKEVDENYTFIDSPHDLYNSESSQQISHEEEENEVLHRDGGYICPSYVNYIKPKRAQNNDGLWKVILNLNESYRGVDYNQHIRIEECVYEKKKCSFAPNYLKSECIQKYSNERLLAWTPDKGIHLDVFRLPIACSCHLTPSK